MIFKLKGTEKRAKRRGIQLYDKAC